jgi:putative ABC transport system permease protein
MNKRRLYTGHMHDFLRDLRFELRVLRMNPGFAITAIVILALAIGANTAVFTVTSALLLRPLPYSSPDKLVMVGFLQKGSASPGNDLSINRYEMLRDSNRSFSGITAAANDSLNLTGVGEPVQVPIARVTWNFFSVLGVTPAIGRVFNESEGRPEGARSILISNSLWRTRFASDPNVVGRVVNLDSIPYTIAGVLPASVSYPFLSTADVWTPRYFEHSLFSTERLRMGVGYLTVLARLKPGVSLREARSEMEVLSQQYTNQNPKAPDAGATIGMTATNIADAVVSGIRSTLLILTAAVMLVLFIACANVASLLLARSLTRRKEIATRLALGATPSKVVRQLVIQGLLLSLSAGVLGSLIAFSTTHIIAKLVTDKIPSSTPMVFDWRVLLFTAVVSLITGTAFSLLPARQLLKTNIISSLVDEGRGGTAGQVRMKLHDALVIGQVALSLVLLIGAGLLVRSFERLSKVTPGFAPQKLLTMDLSLPTSKYAKPDQQTAFFDELRRKVSQQPGIRSVAISTALPLTPKRITPVLPEGQPEVPLAERPFIVIEAISPEWLQTMGVSLLSGRTFTDADVKAAPKVIIVNQAFARRFWPNENPVGKHVAVGRQAPSEVIGVANDVLNSGLAVDPAPQLYLPFAQLPWADANLLVRSELPPESLIQEVKSAVASIDPEQPITNVRSGEELIASGRNQPRLMTSVVGQFSTLAFLLAIVGMYGVLSYAVAQRRRELGIRLALGADRSAIVAMVVKHGLSLTLFGVIAGLVASLVLTRLLASLLFHVSSLDITTFASATVLFTAIAFVASYLPARKAAQVNPVEILH